MATKRPSRLTKDTPEQGSNPISPLWALVAPVAGVLLMGLGGRWAPQAGLGLRSVLAVSELLLALPALVVVVLVARAAELGFARGRSRDLALATLMAPALWGFSLGLLLLQDVFWRPSPAYIETFRRLHEALRPQGPVDVLLSLGAIALLPALCEEVLCRGVVFGALRRALGQWPAILGSAAVFTLIHPDRYRWLFVLAIGIILGLLRERSRTLATTMLAHGTLNALTFSVAPLFDDPSQPLPEPHPLLGLLLLVVGGSVTWLLLRALREDPALATKQPPGTPHRRPAERGRSGPSR